MNSTDKTNSLYDYNEDSKDNLYLNNFYANYDENKDKEEANNAADKNKKKEILKKNYIICKKCSFFPKIEFINNNKLTINCNCGENEYLDVISFKNKYIINYDDEKIKIVCKDHYKEFEAYCQDCKTDICSDCIKTIDLHIVHTTPSFKIDNDKVEDIINTIKEYENESEENQNDDKDNIIELFKIIIKYYDYPYKNLLSLIEYPCQNFVETIKNAYDFLPNFKMHKNQEQNELKKQNKNKDTKKITLRN